MIAHSSNRVLLLACLMCVVGIVSFGCNKTKSNTNSGGPNQTGGAGPDMPGPGGGGAGGPPGPIAADVLAKLPGGEEYAAGKRVFANNNCARCHKLGEAGGGGPGSATGGQPGGPKGPRGGMNGPDLTALGADPVRTKEWIAAHVRDPKAHKQQSRMPASGPDKISDSELDALAAYLASRK